MRLSNLCVLSLVLSSVLVACDDGESAAPDLSVIVDATPTDQTVPDAMTDQGIADAAPADQAVPDMQVADALTPDAAPECPACPGAQTCDPATGACQEPVECGADTDCFDGRHCADGTCTDDCREDAACPGSRVCVLATGRCAEPEMCFTAEDCDPGRHCLGTTCADDCGEANPCPGEQICNPDGTCGDAGLCASDDDCAGARLCNGGTCEAPCAENADCPGTRSCDLDTGRCPEPADCFVAEDCDVDRQCTAGVCQGVCRADDQCPGEQRCDAGACVAPERCEADQDCPGAQICTEGACEAPCTENADCPGAGVCDVGSGRCDDPAGDCQRDADCAPDERCDAGQCLQVQCEANADCPQACVDQRCEDGPPVDCLDDAACAAGTCAPVGICAVAGPCQVDAHCPAGAPLCVGGQCAACLDDTHCFPSEFCREQRCVFLGACAADDDCRGARACVDGQCAAPACEGDRFDFPGRPPVLAVRTHTGLVACDGDEDVYQVTVPADAGLRITARSEDGAALAAWVSPDGRPDVLARAEGLHGVAITGVLPLPAERTLNLHVAAQPGTEVPYSLTLELTAAGACLPDADEGPFGNDTFDTAQTLGAAPQTLRLCAGDPDWIGVDAPGGVALTVTLDTGAIPEGTTLTLHGPDGGALAQGAPDGRSLVVTATTQTPGRHAVEIQHAPGTPSGTAQISRSAVSTPAAPAAACANPPELQLGAHLLAGGVPVNRFSGSCQQGFESAERVFRLHLDAPQTLRFNVNPDDRQTAIYLRRACLDADTEAHCTFGVDLGPVALEAGDWFVFLESGGEPQTLTVTAE